MAGRRRRDMIPENVADNDSASVSQEEAIEENQIVEEDDKSLSDEGDGDDLLENIEDDYKAVPELDQYEIDGLNDEDDFDDIDAEQRRLAEEEIDERNYQKYANKRRIPTALREFDLGEEDEEDLNVQLQRRRQFYEAHNLYESEDDEQMEEEEENKDEREYDKYLDREQARGKLAVWIKEESTVRYIRKTFRKFLNKFKDGSNQLVYKQRIQEMCSKNKGSLEVDFNHINSKHETIAMWIVTEPVIILPYLNDVAMETVKKLYPDYEDIQPEIFVRIENYTILDHIRKLRHKDLGQLIQVRAVVTQRSAIFSQLKKVYYVCRCGDRKGPIYLSSIENHNLGTCPVCQSKGPFILDTEYTIYRNYQRLTIQEPPGSVPPGRVPRQKEVIVLGDNIDVARPGDEIDVTGIFVHRYDYALNVKHGFPVFSTMIEANYIKRVREGDQSSLPPQFIDEINKLSKRSNLSKLICNSIAPSIYEHDHVKMALALAMFGGEHKDIQGKHKIRGDINVLLLGDPGVAKSQFLKSVEKTFHRCVYTTGKGASAVGLTASVKKDSQTKEWTLQGGALVLADKGICLIDEFDKMNDHDRTSIHEAMEQQSISISKVGIVANLQARCSVIAAANPVKGRYDSSASFMDNVNLTDPILSRFDILCVIKDEVNKDLDYKLAGFVLNSHIKNHPISHKEKKHNPELYSERLSKSLIEESQKQIGEIIPNETLRNYIMYARQKIHPKLADIKKEKIKKFYSDLRQQSTISGGMTIAVRHIESIIRMAEAHAKMHLREVVRDEDIDVAINVMLESFIQSQKYSVAKTIRDNFKVYLTKASDNNKYLFNLLNKLQKESKKVLQNVADDKKDKKQIEQTNIPVYHFEFQAKDYKIEKFDDFYRSELFNRYYIKQGNQIIPKNDF
ncbi:MCM2/3/5 family protein (macronuclear) [Tetrahymena thermophila SB210]|uniref:DNA replication licensing factor MCM2 n=1 Tax=Tetrahymena thermophila (strain SB210) TaxID=312017 RepID=Q22UJ8_TETTS|nr:MCM2/3/5 family protein [Tetrahymena thermophila SB210]EAR88972.2 MCM2/3/5 family protein [Tetrahymena thermophila SB210]|eukprot:XP_001009217.2 MCM2/3/5 family protein [Tetrahymena thermophila SB210]